MPNEHRSIKVFLCHAHSDASVVRDLYHRLNRDGVDAWLDKVELSPGQDWEYEIRKAVRESDVVVVCLSKQFNQAGFRQKEVRLALDTAMEKPEGEIFIIPARLEECDTLESLRKWHWVDLFEEDGYDRLLVALQRRAKTIGAPLQENKTGGTRSKEFHKPIKPSYRSKSGPPRSLLFWLAIALVSIAIILSGGYWIIPQIAALSRATPTNEPLSSTRTVQPGTPCPPDSTDVPLVYGVVVTDTICPIGDTDTFQFSGNSGDRIRIQITFVNGTMRPCIELIAPDNTRTTACENSFNNKIDVVLDQTGSYKIVVNVFFGGTGTYTLLVENL